MTRVFLLLLCCTMLAACSQNDAHPASERDTRPVQPGTDAGNGIPIPAPMVEKQSMAQAQAQAVEPLPTQKLRSVLPDVIAGVKGLESSGGSLSSGQGGHWTTASRDYVASDGTFTVSVTDYADIQEVVAPFENDYNVRPSAAEGEVSRFETPNGRGVVVWNKDRRDGWLAFLVDGRFDIRIRTSGLPAKISGPRAVFDALPVSTLVREQ